MGPKNIVPPAAFIGHAFAPATGAVPAATPPKLVNHGGPVIAAVEVVPIYWGSAWGTGGDAQISTQLDAFFDFIVTSSLMDLMAEYSINGTTIRHGSRTASFRLTNDEPGTPSNNGRTVTDAQIQQALQSWITAGTVSPTTANTLYFLFLPPGVVCELSPNEVSCSQLCGYHGHIGGRVFYAVIPYANCSGCVFPTGMLDTLTEVASHELCEAVTDPTLGTWWDPSSGGEIGDICNRDTVSLGPYLVQTEWSNRGGKCLIAPPPPPPAAAGR